MPVPAFPATSTDVGILRALQSIAGDNGFFSVLAIDHPASFILGKPSAEPPTTQDFADAVEVKWDLASKLSYLASALLLDPDMGLPYLVSTGALPGNVGLILGYEAESYQVEPDPTIFATPRPGWTPRKIKLAGGAGLKLLWRYRHELPEAAALRDAVRQLAEECHRVSLPLIMEPIWVPLADEDLGDPKVRAKRAAAVVEYAILSQELGGDIIKTEFPGWVDTPQERADAAKACAKIDAAVSVPWLLLSAGVTFDEFLVQCEIAAKAGSAGYIAGRAVWDEAASIDLQVRAAGIEIAAERLNKLTAVFEAWGTPFQAVGTPSEVLAAYPQGWYRDWHED